MQTTKCLYPSTSGKLEISIPICFITSEGTGTLCYSGEIKFCILPCFWHISHRFTYSLTSPSMLCQKNLSEHFWYVESRPRCDAICFSFTVISYTLVDITDDLLPFLFWFDAKPFAFVHKIFADNGKVSTGPSQSFSSFLCHLKKKVGVVEKSSYIYDIPLLESNQEAYARGDISHVHREWTSENYTRVNIPTAFWRPH